ncbi:septation protein SepH [Arsenicicoccus sp. UBA7492]|uniref:septation protein SepH n=1 Tax=Arsenicicoccus sp. UBA7492 TaxID=1946057 RepID=UPI00257BC486|nr:septation protein SepH [Arsenicicoccus sp. UBA7492]
MSVQDLRLVGISDDGVHLLLATDDGTRYRVPLDAALRSAIRHERPRPGDGPASPSAGPRQVQALIRAGASADEVAELTGWSLDKIARYEGPIIAEREHVAGLATTVRLRTGGGQTAPLLGARVADRLTERGVDPTSASWDAWRAADSPWTLALTFAAGGRLREARWHFDLSTRAVDPVDDEARWLSGDDAPATPGPAPLVPLNATPRVYDVESEGGIHSAQQDDDPGDDLRPITATEPARARRQHDEDEDSDLVDSMRERSRARRRRAPSRPARPVASQESLIPVSGDDPARVTSPVEPASAPVESAPVEPAPARRGRSRKRGAQQPPPPAPNETATSPTSSHTDAQGAQDTGDAEPAQHAPDPSDAPAAARGAGSRAAPTVPLAREEIAAALSQGSVGELDAVVDEVIADREVESASASTPPAPDEPALPQGGPVSRESLRPDDGTEDAANPAPRPHPRVPGQVALPELDHRDDDASEGAEVASPSRATEVPHMPDDSAAPIDEATSLADRTSGTSSRAADVESEKSSNKLPQADPSVGAQPGRAEPAPPAAAQPDADQPEAEQPEAEQPATNRSQRRAQARRKAGRPSVPSWDDIMFGAKPE